MEKILGIDLGTTNSVVSVYDGEKIVIIENPEGNRTTPSIVAFVKDKIIVGNSAKRQVLVNTDVIQSVKRSMGSGTIFKINGKDYKPEQISGFILSYLKGFAEEKFAEKITKAVITVPAYFNDAQRQATKLAGELAGLKVERIINEPTAAALSYGLGMKDSQETILVYDLGGGTFDVSIMKIKKGNYEVLATGGNNKLGGDDFDTLITNLLLLEIKKKLGFDLSKDKLAVQRIRASAEQAKKSLSETYETDILLPFLPIAKGSSEHFEFKLTREKFEEMIMDLAKSTISIVNNTLDDAKLKAKSIDKILLVGGSTRIPLIKELVESELGNKVSKILNPDEVVSVGAAIQGAMLGGQANNKTLKDVTPLSVGIETFDGGVTKVISKNQQIPFSKTLTFTTFENNQDHVLINVVQGERALAKDNISLGKFKLDGITPAPRGSAKIAVKFSIDANGILSLIATDNKTKNQINVVIENSRNISADEISRMDEEAKKFAQNDIEVKHNLKKFYLGLRILRDLERKTQKLSKHGDKHGDEISQLMTNVLKLKTALAEKNVKKLDEVLKTLGKIKEDINNDSNNHLKSE